MPVTWIFNLRDIKETGQLFTKSYYCILNILIEKCIYLIKPLIIVCPTLKAAAENSLVTLGSKSSLYPPWLNPFVRALNPKSFMNFCPSKIGKNSLYITCCHSAFSIRLAFWKSNSSFQLGLISLSCFANRLCSRKWRICKPFSAGCSLFRRSPVEIKSHQ